MLILISVGYYSLHSRPEVFFQQQQQLVCTFSISSTLDRPVHKQCALFLLHRDNSWKIMQRKNRPHLYFLLLKYCQQVLFTQGISTLWKMLFVAMPEL